MNHNENNSAQISDTRGGDQRVNDVREVREVTGEGYLSRPKDSRARLGCRTQRSSCSEQNSKGSVLPFAVLILAAVLSSGCEPTVDERGLEELPTEDLGAGPTDQLRPDDDERVDRSFSTPAGLIPSDFPSDVPLPSGASVAGFGASSESRRYVELDVNQPRSQVREWLSSNWTSWEASGDRWTHRRDGRWLEVSFAERQFGSRLRIDYPARTLP